MVESALRGVVRDALVVAATEGLPGDHHFYVTFRTHFPGVGLSQLLKARHPDEMTIVLQHQFWDMVVDEQNLSVTLSFSGTSEHLQIPLAAITGFADPSAKFGLQFQIVEDDDGEGGEDVADENRPVAALPPDGGGESGKVVALDAFRKK